MDQGPNDATEGGYGSSGRVYVEQHWPKSKSERSSKSAQKDDSFPITAVKC